MSTEKRVRRHCKRCGQARHFRVRQDRRGNRQVDCIACSRRRGRSRENGGARDPLRVTYNCMLSRCYDERAVNYSYYGGRGIRVCERWRGEAGFENFRSDMGKRPQGLTLDRVDPDGHYTPDNCRWATRKEQVENRRTGAAMHVTYRRKRKNYAQA